MADFLDVQSSVRAQLKVNVPGSHADISKNEPCLHYRFLKNVISLMQSEKTSLPVKQTTSPEIESSVVFKEQAMRKSERELL